MLAAQYGYFEVPAQAVAAAAGKDLLAVLRDPAILGEVRTILLCEPLVGEPLPGKSDT
jgi:hypothetical protein